MKMINVISLLTLFFFILFVISMIHDADAHSLFNSQDSVIGDFRVQVATLPEIPTTGEKSQLLFRVNDLDFNEVDEFTMGVRVFYDDVLVDEILPKFHQGSHWETDYVFERSGNHIFRVDLYNAAKDGGVITYTFNLSTLNPFGYIFFFSIAAGSIGLAVIFCYIYLPKRLKSRSKF